MKWSSDLTDTSHRREPLKRPSAAEVLSLMKIITDLPSYIGGNNDHALNLHSDQ